MDFLKELKVEAVNLGGCIDGERWLGDSDKILDSMNPANEVLLGQVQCVSSDNYEAIIQASQATFQKWQRVPGPQRGDIIRQIGDALRTHKDALGSLVSAEMGKSKQEGDGEVQEMIDIADFAVGQSRMLYGKTMPSERFAHRMFEQWHPLGPVGVITAFNFPVAVWAWNAFIAAVCGNTVIWKPSSTTPLCAIAVQTLCNDILATNGHPGVFSLMIPESHELANSFTSDPRLPLISFTGSTKTGRHVNQLVAKRLGRCLLELGGNNAVILDEDADLQLAIPAIVFGSVGTAGQRCTSTRRLIIHHKIYDKVVEKLRHAYGQVTIGDPLDPKNLMGPLCNPQAVENFQKALVAVQAQGGKIIFGGEVLKGKGFYVQPTLVEADNRWEIVQQETFAPILYLMKYTDLEEAIDTHNGVAQGLSSAIFTQNLKHGERFLCAWGSDCGIANVNIGTSGAEIGGAFGGEKDTGGGREAGSDAWKAYMRRQTSTINWGDELPLAQGIEFNL